MSEDSLDDILVENNSQYGEIEYAGFWLRVGAAVLDTLVLAPIMLLGFYNTLDFKSLPLMFVLLILHFVYKPFMEFYKGATFGKMWLKIKVVDENMNRISLNQAIGRYGPWIITAILQTIMNYSMFTSPEFGSINGFAGMRELMQQSPLQTTSEVYSYIFLIIVGFVGIDPRKQGLHDKIARTFCIKVKK